MAQNSIISAWRDLEAAAPPQQAEPVSEALLYDKFEQQMDKIVFSSEASAEGKAKSGQEEQKQQY